MTRFRPQGSRIAYNMSETSDRNRETPFKQLVGLYGMWNSLGPETKLRIKKALGVELNAEDEWALRRLDKQRAQLQDYMDNGGQAEKLKKTADTMAAEQQAIQDPIREQLAAAQQMALDTPYTWTGEAAPVYVPEADSVPSYDWSNLTPVGRTPRRDPDLSRAIGRQEGIPRPSIGWVNDPYDTWELR